MKTRKNKSSRLERGHSPYSVWSLLFTVIPLVLGLLRLTDTLCLHHRKTSPVFHRHKHHHRRRRQLNEVRTYIVIYSCVSLKLKPSFPRRYASLSAILLHISWQGRVKGAENHDDPHHDSHVDEPSPPMPDDNFAGLGNNKTACSPKSDSPPFTSSEPNGGHNRNGIRLFPHMILPIYSILAKLDGCLIEAADLGCNGGSVLRRVIFPP